MLRAFRSSRGKSRNGRPTGLAVPPKGQCGCKTTSTTKETQSIASPDGNEIDGVDQSVPPMHRVPGRSASKPRVGEFIIASDLI